MDWVYVLTQGDDHVLWGVLSNKDVATRAMIKQVDHCRYTLDCVEEDSVSETWWWVSEETGELVKWTIERVTLDDPDLFRDCEEDKPKIPRGALRLDPDA